jgi:hypothetical protein
MYKNRQVRKGQLGQDTAGKAQPRHKCKNEIDRTEQTERNRQNGTGRTDRQNMTCITGQPGHDCQGHVAPGQAARTGQPGEDSQGREARTE